MRRLLLLVLGVLLLSAQLLAQTRTVSGKVKDEKGNGIANASVTIKGSRQGTTTTTDGSYVINVPGTATTLVISSVGFGSSEVTISNRSSIDVQLTADSRDMNEVVVVAYGTVKKGENTSSPAQINYDNFKNRPLTNVSGVLDGA